MSAIIPRIEALEWKAGCRRRGMTPEQITRLRTLSHYRGWLAVATYDELCELREMSKKKIDQDCEDEVIMIPREPKSRGK